MRSPQGCSSPRTGGISFGLDSWHWSTSRITFAGPITIGNTKNSAPPLTLQTNADYRSVPPRVRTVDRSLMVPCFNIQLRKAANTGRSPFSEAKHR